LKMKLGGNLPLPSSSQPNSTNSLLANATSPQKPIRTHFKVPSEGIYRLLDELVFNFPKTQRKIYRSLSPTKFSYLFVKEESTHISDHPDKKITKETENKDNNNSNGNGVSINNNGHEEGIPLLYFVFNIAESISFHYLKNSQNASTREKTAPMNFRILPTCHDINKVTSSGKKVDLLIGFESGDILLYEPLHKTYSLQFNKEPRINTGKVTTILWVPGSKSLFAAAFSNGIILFMDRDRDDQPASATTTKDPESFAVTKQKNSKWNPVARWHVSKKSLSAVSFSPDGQYLAIAGEDGYLRIFNYEDEVLLVSFRSYFGGFLCVNWSPDGKYLVTGGEDDLVCIWSLSERALLARGQGHRSWVTCARFDPFGCDGHKYRIGSVGEDTRLLLWDFEREVLRRPRNLSLSFSSISTKLLLQQQLQQQQQQQQNQQIHAAVSTQPFSSSLVVDSHPRNEVATISPLVEHRTHHEPVSDLVFFREFLATCCWGKLKFWGRPEFVSQSTPPNTTSTTNTTITTTTGNADNNANNHATMKISQPNGTSNNNGNLIDSRNDY